jgi:hypothetical protein
MIVCKQGVKMRLSGSLYAMADNKNNYPRSDIPFLPFTASCVLEGVLLAQLYADAYLQVHSDSFVKYKLILT